MPGFVNDKLKCLRRVPRQSFIAAIWITTWAPNVQSKYLVGALEWPRVVCAQSRLAKQARDATHLKGPQAGPVTRCNGLCQSRPARGRASLRD